MPHAPSRLSTTHAASLGLAIVAAVLLAACSDTLTRAPLPDEGQFERVDGDVSVSSNDDLVMLHAFDRLTSVGGMLQIGVNPALTALPTFSALASASDVSLLAGPALERIEGFNAMTTIDRLLRLDVEVTGDTVTLDGFYALTTIGRPPFISPAVTVLCPSLQAIESDDVFAVVPCVEPV